MKIVIERSPKCTFEKEGQLKHKSDWHRNTTVTNFGRVKVFVSRERERAIVTQKKESFSLNFLFREEN